MNRIITLLVVATLLIIGIGVAPRVLTGSTPLIHLAKTSPLGGEISQAIGPDTNHHLLVAGKDLSIDSVKYLYGTTWAVAAIHTTQVSDKAVVVLQQQDNYYKVVLGPGTSFAHSDVIKLPADVRAYLVSQGAVYESN